MLGVERGVATAVTTEAGTIAAFLWRASNESGRETQSLRRKR